MNVSQSGFCSIGGEGGMPNCRKGAGVRLIVLSGSGWPEDEARRGALRLNAGPVFDSAGRSANAFDLPSVTHSWKVPEGSRTNTTLLVQFTATANSGAGKVATHFWYAWQGP
jgi:hypothetical protein